MRIKNNVIQIRLNDTKNIDVKKELDYEIQDLLADGHVSIYVYVSTKVHGSVRVGVNSVCEKYRNKGISICWTEFVESL